DQEIALLIVAGDVQVLGRHVGHVLLRPRDRARREQQHQRDEFERSHDQIPLMSRAASSSAADFPPGFTASSTFPRTRCVLAISPRSDSITLSSRERIVGYDTPTCSAISFRFPPASTNISMNRWCSTGSVPSRDMGNAASIATLQRPHEIRVTTSAPPQYAHSLPTGRSSAILHFQQSMLNLPQQYEI